MIVIEVLAIFFAFQAGYWLGRRARPSNDWDWRVHALESGWNNQLHKEHPGEFDQYGRRYSELEP